MSIVADRIKASRERLGMSVTELADKLGKNRATVYRYESDYIESMPLNILEDLSKALNVSPWFLMGWSDDPEPLQMPREITRAKKEVISMLDDLSDDQACAVLAYIETMKRFKNKEGE